MAIQDILGNPIPFLTSIQAELAELGIDMAQFPIDHICYRVDSIERYQYLSDLLNETEELLIESPIGGRMISTFRLSEPIQFLGQHIELIELPAPKLGSDYSEGFEHLEMVISLSFTEFMAQYPHLKFDFSGMDKALNPDIRLALKEGRSVKFHHQTLAEVIKQELGI